MPIRFLTHLEIPLAAVITFLAAASGVDGLQSGAIWDKSQLRIWCILGAMLGALLAIGLLPSTETQPNYTRRIALKYGCSLVCGLVFTPILIRYYGLPVDSDVVLAVSCVVAGSSVSFISVLGPYLMKRATGAAMNEIDSRFPAPPEARQVNAPPQQQPQPPVQP